MVYQYAGNGRFIPEAELDQYEDGERYDNRILYNYEDENPIVVAFDVE